MLDAYGWGDRRELEDFLANVRANKRPEADGWAGDGLRLRGAYVAAAVRGSDAAATAVSASAPG